LQQNLDIAIAVSFTAISLRVQSIPLRNVNVNTFLPIFCFTDFY